MSDALTDAARQTERALECYRKKLAIEQQQHPLRCETCGHWASAHNAEPPKPIMGQPISSIKRDSIKSPPMVRISVDDAERLAVLLLNGKCPTQPEDVAAYTRLCDALTARSSQQAEKPELLALEEAMDISLDAALADLASDEPTISPSVFTYADYPQWDAATHYQGGEQVLFNGKIETIAHGVNKPPSYADEPTLATHGGCCPSCGYEMSAGQWANHSSCPKCSIPIAKAIRGQK